MNPTSARPSRPGLEIPRTSLSATRAVVRLWHPHIVLASRVERTDLEAARTLADGLATARLAFGAQAAAARERAACASSERERVTAALAAYRAEAALDEVLTGTLREVTALLERRGLR